MTHLGHGEYFGHKHIFDILEADEEGNLTKSIFNKY